MLPMPSRRPRARAQTRVRRHRAPSATPSPLQHIDTGAKERREGPRRPRRHQRPRQNRAKKAQGSSKAEARRHTLKLELNRRPRIVSEGQKVGERTLTSMTFFSRSCRVSIWVLRKTWTNLCVGDRRGDGANQHRDGDGGDTHLPALDRPGPSRRGICLIKASEARKASYFLASCECQRDREEATPHLLDQLLVLVELFQVIHAHVLELDLLGAVDVGRVGEDADGHARARHMRELGGAGETLVALRVAGRGVRHRATARARRTNS